MASTLWHPSNQFDRTTRVLHRALDNSVVPANMQSTRSIASSLLLLMEPRNCPAPSGARNTRDDSMKPRFEFQPTAMIGKFRSSFLSPTPKQTRPTTEMLPFELADASQLRQLVKVQGLQCGHHRCTEIRCARHSCRDCSRAHDGEAKDIHRVVLTSLICRVTRGYLHGKFASFAGSKRHFSYAIVELDSPIVHAFWRNPSGGTRE